MLVQPKKFSRVPRYNILPVVVFCAAIISSVSFIPEGPAWSFETVTSVHDESPAITIDHHAALTSSSAAGAEDPCLPLLKAVRYSAASSSPAVNQRSTHGDAAGQAAALGLIIGVRFALGPQETTGSGQRRSSARLDVWQPNDNIRNPHALAVADYRHCRKDQALKALSKWRWSR